MKRYHYIKKNVNILTFNRNRIINIYLPNDYYISDKDYPLFIMHDGQNLSIDRNDGSMNKWSIDKYIEEYQNCIIVGIDCDSSHRLNEYAPFNLGEIGLEIMNSSNLVGIENVCSEGSQYVEWIVNSLISDIKNEYRINDNIGIIGSSMGGLISLYAALKYRDIFSMVGILSPAYWYSDIAIIDYLNLHEFSDKCRVYTSVGDNETGLAKKKYYLEPYDKVHSILINKNIILNSHIIKEGIHNETSWSQQVRIMLNFLLG